MIGTLTGGLRRYAAVAVDAGAPWPRQAKTKAQLVLAVSAISPLRETDAFRVTRCPAPLCGGSSCNRGFAEALGRVP